MAYSKVTYILFWVYTSKWITKWTTELLEYGAYSNGKFNCLQEVGCFWQKTDTIVRESLITEHPSGKKIKQSSSASED